MMSLSGRTQPYHSNLLPLFLSLSVVFFFVLFSLSSGHHSRQHLQARNLTDANEIINGDRRWIGEVSDEQNSAMLLAKDRTSRRDPTDGFKRYNGGWSITNSHYWASAASSALPLFVIAAAWFVGFGLTLLITCMRYCCCRKQTYGYSSTCYALSVVLFSFFTLASIAGCVFLYIGQGRFHSSTRNTLQYVVGQADATSKNLTSVSTYLDSAKKIGMQGMTLPPDTQDNIESIQKTADSAADGVITQTHQNYKRIMKIVDRIRYLLIGVASIMILFTIAGFVFSISGAKCIVYTLIILGWILITVTFLLSGIFLVLHNVAGDTCVAMEEWVRNPTAHTTLDDILPCVNKDDAHNILRQSKKINQQLVSLVDTVFTNVSNVDFPPDAPGSVFFNQSGPLLPVLCSPYNPDLSDRICASGEVDYSNAIEVWKKYVCKVGANNKTCITPGRLNPTNYEQAKNAEYVSYGLYTYTPFLVQLADCTFVRSTFKDVSKIYCPGIRTYTKWIYYGLTIVSISVMFALIFWGIYARERRHRLSSKELVKGTTRGGFKR